MELLKSVVDACKIDRDLRNVVKNIALMSGEEKDLFLKKVKAYYLLKTDETDREAYRFYKVVLENNNAKIILQELEGCH